jgi:hypothetical protein
VRALSSLNREAVLALVGLQRQNKSIYSHNTFLIFDGHHIKVHNKVSLIRCLFLSKDGQCFSGYKDYNRTQE